MTEIEKPPGHLMATEAAEALRVFRDTARLDVPAGAFGAVRAIYTLARGSSDAAANVLSYEFMRELGLPMTSLPPSVFSLGAGVTLDGAGVLIVSQSGASDDLVRSAAGARRAGARVIALLNRPDSPVEAECDLTLPIGAGEERAVPATKTVIGSIAAGMALLGAMKPAYRARAEASVTAIGPDARTHPRATALRDALLARRPVYVIGRDTGFGAAHEIALKLKECCAIHAEAYSSSEVLHGPLQLATNPLTVLILDTGEPTTRDSLDQAERRFRATGSAVHRIAPADLDLPPLVPSAAAALLLAVLYPVIHDAALELGLDPDRPATLAKVTRTT